MRLPLFALIFLALQFSFGSAGSAETPDRFERYNRHAADIKKSACSHSADPRIIVQERDFILKTFRESLVKCMYNNRLLETCLRCSILNEPCQGAISRDREVARQHKEAIWSTCSEKIREILKDEGLLSATTAKWNMRFIEKHAEQIRNYLNDKGPHPKAAIEAAKNAATTQRDDRPKPSALAR